VRPHLGNSWRDLFPAEPRSIVFATLRYQGSDSLGDGGGLVNTGDLSQTALETPNETVTGEELFVVCVFCHGDKGRFTSHRPGSRLAMVLSPE